MAGSLGKKEQARDYYEQALPIAREIGDREGEGVTLNNLGMLADRLGKTEEAQRYYEQALPIQREIGDREGEGLTLNNLGMLADSLGNKEEAQRYYEQALPIRREIGDREGEGVTLNNLGMLADSLGKTEQARRLLGASAGYSPADRCGRCGRDRGRQSRITYKRDGSWTNGAWSHAHAAENLALALAPRHTAMRSWTGAIVSMMLGRSSWLLTR